MRTGPKTPPFRARPLQNKPNAVLVSHCLMLQEAKPCAGSKISLELHAEYNGLPRKPCLSLLQHLDSFNGFCHTSMWKGSPSFSGRTYMSHKAELFCSSPAFPPIISAASAKITSRNAQGSLSSLPSSTWQVQVHVTTELHVTVPQVTGHIYMDAVNPITNYNSVNGIDDSPTLSISEECTRA